MKVVKSGRIKNKRTGRSNSLCTFIIVIIFAILKLTRSRWTVYISSAILIITAVVACIRRGKYSTFNRNKIICIICSVSVRITSGYTGNPCNRLKIGFNTSGVVCSSCRGNRLIIRWINRSVGICLICNAANLIFGSPLEKAVTWRSKSSIQFTCCTLNIYREWGVCFSVCRCIAAVKWWTAERNWVEPAIICIDPVCFIVTGRLNGYLNLRRRAVFTCKVNFCTGSSRW